MGVLGCWGDTRGVCKNFAALAKQKHGCVQWGGPHPAGPAASSTAPMGPTQLRARLLDSAGDVGGDKQCGTAQHGMSPRFASPSMPPSDAET